MASTQIIDVEYDAPGLVGPDGKTGSPGITAVTAESVPADQEATATLSDTTLHLQIPRGKGEKGDPGPVGVTSATASGLPAGSKPTVGLTDGVLALGIPAGERGETGRPLTILGQVASKANLPTAGVETGDAYQSVDDMHVHQWNGTQWLDLGEFGPVTANVTASAPLSGSGSGANPLKVAVATTTSTGVVKAGANLTVDATGLLSAAATRVVAGTEELPTGLTVGSTVIRILDGSIEFYREDGNGGQ